jgi:putative endonuclease
MKKIRRTGGVYVYIVRCAGGQYYTGFTNDLDARIKCHNSGKGAKYLRGKLPVELVYKKPYKYLKGALKAECAMKKLTHAQKDALINKRG